MPHREKRFASERGRFFFRGYWGASIFARMQFGICNEIFEDWALEDISALLQGPDTTQWRLPLYYRQVCDGDRGGGPHPNSRRCCPAEIAISGIHWVLVQADGMYLTSPDADVRRRSARYFVELVDFCGDIGARGHRRFTQAANIAEGTDPEQAWAWARETFEESVRRAEDRGVVICIEPLSPAETNSSRQQRKGGSLPSSSRVRRCRSFWT
jgi:hypothetical protein